ncbi:DinB family protein [Aeromicrobium sp. A1-2]|uniref:DinB family protein n=1 Tax=Aeromicrobium sp. A1-2 TaxID=2107713 RepID=UPI001C1FB8DB|nr:DinB family protein [Aeromicrobium sp. A1-2]
MNTRAAPPHAPERQTLEAFLDVYRVTVVRKATGLTDADGARRLLPSLTTVSGLLRHLADNERSWFREIMAGEDDVPSLWSAEDPDAEFRVTQDDTVATLIADYETACAESRATIEAFNLEDRCVGLEQQYTLRWILLHMLEETARHAGHLDILRELLDGKTGE